MSRLACIAFALSMLFSASATAQVAPGNTTFAPDDVKTVTMLLMGYHDIAPQASFDAVANASQIVERLAHGPHSVVRDRALGALGRYWPSADVYLLYANVVAAAATPDGTRYRVVLMFAETFGDRAIPALQPLLQADDLQLRITTVQALGSIRSDAAFDLLLDYSKTVENAALLAQIDQSARVLR